MAWYDSNWQYRKEITIDSTKVDGDLTDFPVLVNLDSDGDLSANAQSSGDDILFTKSDGTTKLSHEIESYDGGTGTLWSHIKIPSLSSSSDTTIYVYYGNSGASNQENVSDVWSNNFEIVYHMDESASGTGNTDIYKDSTANNRHGDDEVSATGQDGQLSDGQVLDGSDDWIPFPTFGTDTSSPYSTTGWLRNSTPENGEFFYSWEHEFGSPWQMGAGWDSTAGVDFYDGSNYNNLGTLPADTWTRFSLTHDPNKSGDEIQGYLDGSPTVTIPDNHNDGSAFSEGAIGDHEPNGGANWGGALDEFRISSTVRSDAWVSTSYANQNSPSTFYTVGSEEINEVVVSMPSQSTSLSEYDPTAEGATASVGPSAQTLSTAEYDPTAEGATASVGVGAQSLAVDGQAPTPSAPTTVSPTFIPSDWYDINWEYRKKITIDSAKVDGDLTDFPVLVKLDADSDLSNNAQSSGDDILFTDSASNPTKLSHEIESYDSGTGTLWAHVKLPNVSSSSDTDVYVYYGNSGATNQENVSDVWSNGYEGVWHLDEETTGTGTADVYKDSTANDNHGDDYVSATNQDGQIHEGQAVDGADDYIGGPANNSVSQTHPISLSAWIRTDTTSKDFQTIIGKRDGQTIAYQFRIESGGGIHYFFGTGDSYVTFPKSWNYNTGTWYRTDVTVSSSGDIQYYVDGSSFASATTSKSPSNPTGVPVGIASRSGSDAGEIFSGSLDEVRLSSVDRSDAWVSTSYANQNDPLSFYTVGSQESGGGGGESLTLEEQTATVSGSTFVQPSAATASITTLDPLAEGGSVAIQPSVQTATVSSVSPSVDGTAGIGVKSQQVTLTEQSPTVDALVTVGPSYQTITVTELEPKDTILGAFTTRRVSDDGRNTVANTSRGNDVLLVVRRNNQVEKQ